MSEIGAAVERAKRAIEVADWNDGAWRCAAGLAEDVLMLAAALEAKGCPCGNVRNRADNTRAFCPHCNGIDAKGKS